MRAVSHASTLGMVPRERCSSDGRNRVPASVRSESLSSCPMSLHNPVFSE